MTAMKAKAEVNLDSLYRIFTVPESNGTLSQIDSELSSNLDGFLRQHIVAEEMDLADIERNFSSTIVPEQPEYVSGYTDFILEHLVSQSVHTSAPGFVGHMTSALPYFMLPLAKVVTALNQNLVKVETSKAFTPLERQVVGMLHNLVYSESDAFYKSWLHNPKHALGAFCSGGTVANITALWAARNHCLGAECVAAKGLHGAMQEAGYKGLVVLVSKRGHYSLAKSADLLGIGRDNLVAIDTDDAYRVDVEALRQKGRELIADGYKVLSVVGLAGATETGSVDPLDKLADIAEEFDAHFHVDAAWGGATLFSESYRSVLKGIERADSVTIDAHKQFYVPMGAGAVIFKDPARLSVIEHHAEYIIRRGSKDIGSHTLEGSRPGMALLVHAGLHIIGREGYEMLIDRGMEKARYFAEQVKEQQDFELLVEPELNILGYRYVPAEIQQQLTGINDPQLLAAINQQLDKLTKHLQKAQRAAGKTFVSRTRVEIPRYHNETVSMFRVVLANPLSSRKVIDAILVEQRELAQLPKARAILAELQVLLAA